MKAKNKYNHEFQRKAFKKLCIEEGLPEPIPEYVFHKTRKWRIDYYFERNGVKVGLEVEGGVHSGGRHVNPVGFLNDIEKYNEFSKYGIWLVRVTPQNLLRVTTTDFVTWILGNNGCK